jgi:hypothetical protein
VGPPPITAAEVVCAEGRGEEDRSDSEWSVIVLFTGNKIATQRMILRPKHIGRLFSSAIPVLVVVRDAHHAQRRRLIEKEEKDVRTKPGRP